MTKRIQSEDRISQPHLVHGTRVSGHNLYPVVLFLVRGHVQKLRRDIRCRERVPPEEDFDVGQSPLLKK